MTAAAQLLRLGANPNIPVDLRDSRARAARQSYGGHTPLVQAAWHGHVAAVRALVGHGADRALRSASGQTALLVARGRPSADAEACARLLQACDHLAR